MSDVTYHSFFAALACNQRLDILQYLHTNGTSDVTAIAKGTGIEQSAVSHSLKKLLSCELVHVRQDGKRRFYTLNASTTEPILQLVDEHIAKYCSGCCDSCITGTAKSTNKATQTK